MANSLLVTVFARFVARALIFFNQTYLQSVELKSFMISSHQIIIH